MIKIYNTNVDQLPQAQQTLFSLEALTVNATGTIKELKEKLKRLRQMQKDGYENSEAYRLHMQQVKERQLVLKQTKFEIDKIGMQQELNGQIKELSQELREKKFSISDYALEYERMSGQSTIEIDGELYAIIKTAQLVKTK